MFQTRCKSTPEMLHSIFLLRQFYTCLKNELVINKLISCGGMFFPSILRANYANTA